MLAVVVTFFRLATGGLSPDDQQGTIVPTNLTTTTSTATTQPLLPSTFLPPPTSGPVVTIPPPAGQPAGITGGPNTTRSGGGSTPTTARSGGGTPTTSRPATTTTQRGATTTTRQTTTTANTSGPAGAQRQASIGGKTYRIVNAYVHRDSSDDCRSLCGTANIDAVDGTGVNSDVVADKVWVNGPNGIQEFARSEWQTAFHPPRAVGERGPAINGGTQVELIVRLIGPGGQVAYLRSDPTTVNG